MTFNLTFPGDISKFRLRDDVILRILGWGYFFIFMKLQGTILAYCGESPARIFSITTACLLVLVASPAMFVGSIADFERRLVQQLTVAGVILYVPVVSLSVTAICIYFDLA